jgi:hypothetical protein
MLKLKTKNHPNLLLIILLALTIAATSCYKIDDESEPAPKVTRLAVQSERDFVLDSNLYSLPGEVMVINLEHQGTPQDSIPYGTDTDGIGVDIVPLKIKDTINISFRIDTFTYIIEMYDKLTGQKVLLLNEDIPQRIRRYDPGDYLLHITSLLNYGDDTLNFQLIFIQPDITSTKSSAGEVFWFIESRVRVCKECNMRYIDLSGYDLSHVQITKSDLFRASLEGALMPLSDFSETDLSYCNLKKVYAPYSVFNSAILELAVLNNANIMNADMQYADFTWASLLNANAVGTNFCNAIKKGWKTSGMQTDSTTLCYP